MGEGYRPTGDRYRLGRGPVWTHNVPGGLDWRLASFFAGGILVRRRASSSALPSDAVFIFCLPLRAFSFMVEFDVDYVFSCNFLAKLAKDEFCVTRPLRVFAGGIIFPYPYRNVQSGHAEVSTRTSRHVLVIGVGHREANMTWLHSV